MRTNLENPKIYEARMSGLRHANVVITLTGTQIIPSDGPTVWVLDGGASDRTVRLPALTTDKQIVIANAGLTSALNVTDANGVALVSIIPNATGIFYAGTSRWLWIPNTFSSNDLIATRVVTTSGAVNTTDINLQVNGAGAVVLSLPTSASWQATSGGRGLPLSIFDISGNAAANNITINPSIGQTISGLASLTIDTNFGGYQIEPKIGGTGWVVHDSGSVLDNSVSFDSYVAAQAATVGANVHMIVLNNYYSTLTGGYGVWIKGTASAVTQANLVTADGVTFVYSPMGSIEAKALGAKGDLSPNDQTFINAALTFAAGRKVHLPVGRYRLNSAITYDGAIHLVGDGNGCSVVSVNGDLSPNVEDNNCTQIVAYFSSGNVFSSASHHPCILESFQLTTNSASIPRSSGAGIFIDGNPSDTLKFRTGIRIKNVAVINQFDGIVLHCPYMPMIADCFFGGWGHFGINYTTTSPTEGGGGVLENCDFWGNSGSLTQVACVSTEVGYIDIRENLILGSLLGVFVNIKNGNAGAVWVRDNWIENQGNHGIYAQSGDGGILGMVEFSGNEFSNLAYASNWNASITIADYTASADWILDVIIRDNVHRHNVSAGARFLWIQSGKNVLIQGEVIENTGAGVTTTGIDIGGASPALKVPLQVLDCQFLGTFLAKYVGVGTVTIRDSAGVTFATLPVCANGSRIWVTDGLPGSNPGAGGGAGTWFDRVGGIWVSSPANVVLPKFTASLGADVALNNTANFFDGPTIAQGTVGTWFVSGTIMFTDSAQGTIRAKLWDGTTIIDTGGSTVIAGGAGTITLSGYITNPAGNLRISARDVSNTTGLLLFNNGGASKDCTISAIRVG